MTASGCRWQRDDRGAAVRLLVLRASPEYSITQVPFQISSRSDLEAHGTAGARKEQRQTESSVSQARQGGQQGRPGGQESQGRSDQGRRKGKGIGGEIPRWQTGRWKASGGQHRWSGNPAVRSSGDGKSARSHPARREAEAKVRRPERGQKGKDLRGRLEAGRAESGPTGVASGKRPAGWPRARRAARSSSTGRPIAKEVRPTAGDATDSQSSADQKPTEPPSEGTSPESAPKDNPFESEADPAKPVRASSGCPIHRDVEQRARTDSLRSQVAVQPDLIAIVGYLLWRNRERVMEALRNFWAAIREFWENLFGRRRAERK